MDDLKKMVNMEPNISIVAERENCQSSGSIYKEAKSFKEIESGIYNLIELSNVPDICKIKGAKMSHSIYFVRLNSRSFKPRQLLGILRSIIEHSNFELIKHRNAVHITPEP